MAALKEKKLRYFMFQKLDILYKELKAPPGSFKSYMEYQTAFKVKIFKFNGCIFRQLFFIFSWSGPYPDPDSMDLGP
jgi:hypothetical protein